MTAGGGRDGAGGLHLQAPCTRRHTTYLWPMSVESLFYYRSANAASAIPELSIVALRADLTLNDKRVMPAETEGTVVGLWGDGKGYVVEFDEPFHAIATLEAEQLREVVRFGD